MQIYEFQQKEYGKALEECFLKLDQKIKDNNIDVSGCTANVVLITQTQIICANAGDSRAAMKNSSKTIPLSFDHKPNDEGEVR